MNIIVDKKQTKLQDSAYYKIRLTDEKERIVPIGFDISSIKIKLPPDILQIDILIGHVRMASFRNGEDFSNFPIYTSLLEYHPVDIYFLFDENNWIPVQLTKKEEQYGERVTIYDGTYYHHGDIVTDKIVSYIGRKRVVTIPEITLELIPETEIKSLIVPIRELVKNVDKEYKAVLQKHSFEEIDDRTGYVTNQIIYMNGRASLKYIF